MSTHPLEIPAQFSTLMGMGTPQAVFKGKVSLTARLIFAVFFALGGGAALLYALYIFCQRWGRYYPPVIFEAALPYLIGAVVAFGIVIVLLWGVYSLRKKAVVVYDNGFAYSDRKSVKTWQWEQVDLVYMNVVRHYTNRIYTGTSHTYTLHSMNGDKVVFNDSLQDVESLYNFVQNYSFQLRYGRYADAYNAGNVVHFGQVSISKTGGIQIGKKAYPWDDIQQVGINKGVLSVKKKDGGWFSGASATAGSIPNLYVLLSIIDQLVGLKTT